MKNLIKYSLGVFLFVVTILSFTSDNPDIVQASIIGVMTTGAAVQTSLDKDKLHQFLQVGSIDTDLPITQFVVTVSGRTPIRIVGQSFVQAFAKLTGAGLLGADVKKSMILPIGIGGKGNTACNYALTNAGATTPNIYGKSIARLDESAYNGGLIEANMVTIQDGDSRSFEGFDYLLVDPTNLQDDVTAFDMVSGWGESALNLEELPAITALSEDILDADGKLAGLVLIDSEIVESCELFASGGSVSVLVVNMPD